MNESEFWKILDMLDWKHTGNDDKVLKPAVQYLSKKPDSEIFEFEEIMAKLLYDIDGLKWAKDVYKSFEDFSDDDFLYTRCVAIVNGKEYYYAVKNQTKKLIGDSEFEAILYLPENAWAMKNGKEDATDYPNLTKYSYESGSNAVQWSKTEDKRFELQHQMKSVGTTLSKMMSWLKK